MKWIMPALIVICTIFTLFISVYRFNAVELEMEALTIEINDISFEWIDNYYMEMNALNLIFFDPDYQEGSYLSYFGETYEERLKYWNEFSLVPELLKGVLIIDENTGQSVYLDAEKSIVGYGVSADFESYINYSKRISVSGLYTSDEFPLYSAELGVPFIPAKAGRNICLIFLDYQNWRYGLPEVLNRIAVDGKPGLSKLYTVRIEEGDQSHTDNIVASDEIDAYPLTRITFDADYFKGQNDVIVELPDSLSENVELQYSAIARHRQRTGSREIGDENEWMDVSISGTGVWAVLYIEQRALIFEAVRIQLGAIFLTYAALSTLIILIFILLRYNRKAAKLVSEQRSFVANVSHELRTPLAVICNAGANLEQGFVRGEQRVAKYGRMIREEGGRLTSMVESILLYSGFQLGRSKNEQFDFNKLVDEIIRPMQFLCEQKKIEFEFQVEENLEFSGDREGISSAIMNLLSNGIIHGGEGGWLNLSIRHLPDGNFLEVRVEDRGPGISRTEHKKIFSAFSRGAEAEAKAVPGSGLGLSLVSKVAALHGGSIDVESEKGRGAIFILKLAMREEDGRENPNTAD